MKSLLTTKSAIVSGFLFVLPYVWAPQTVAQSNTFPSTGNVGIGTTTPNGKLDVMGGSIVVQPAASGGFMLINDPSWGNAGLFSTTASGDIHLKAYSAGFATPQLFLKNGGNVGIGTTSPAATLDVNGSLVVKNASSGHGLLGLNTTSNDKYAYLVLGDASAPYGWQLGKDVNSGGLGGANGFYIYSYQAGSTSLAINTNGYVGIGTTSPGYKLDVNGNINSRATITGNTIVAKYQDVAEWVPSSEKLSAGTVVVLDSTKSNQVISSTVSYDTRVAGVISAQPGITLGEQSEDKVLVSTTGRVKVKVDATKSPIHIGDLLVTSDVAGVAMKSEPLIIQGRQIHAPGTLIGKALEPLAKGQGEILVLLSLQ